MSDPVTAVFNFLDKCLKPAKEATVYLLRKRRQETEQIEDIWKDVIAALATRHFPQLHINNPGPFDLFENNATQRKYRKAWKVAEASGTAGTRYRVSLLILGVISRNFISQSAVTSFISSVLDDCGFDLRKEAPPMLGGKPYIGKSYGALFNMVLNEMAAAVRDLPSSVTKELNVLANEKYELTTMKDDEKDFSDFKKELAAAKLEEKKHWRRVKVPGDHMQLATGKLAKQSQDTTQSNSDLMEAMVLVPKGKKEREILWILSGAMEIGHTLDHTKHAGIDACELCHGTVDTNKQGRKAIWHAFIPGCRVKDMP